MDGQPEDDGLGIGDEDDETLTDPAGEPGDEGEDAGGADEGTGGDPEDAGDDEPVAPRQSRGDRQVGALRAERQRLAEDNARLTREASELRERMSRQPLEDPRVEQERVALMSPEERADYRVNQALSRHEQQTRALHFQLMDQADKASFDARATADPLRTKLSPEVERRLAEVRRNGGNATRDVVYTYMLGERVQANRGAAKGKTAQNRLRQVGKPSRGQGDVEGDRRERRDNNSEAALERRLANVEI